MATKTIRFEPTNVGDEIILDNKALTTMESLWTNASPSVSFSSQTIPLDLSEYSLIFIKYSRTVGNAESIYLFGAKGIKYYVNYSVYATGIVTRQRITEIKANGVVFSEAKSDGNTDNTILIPLEIYGIK